jgi:hypothetical protein
VSRTTDKQREACPNKAAHVTGEPEGYLSWFEWAELKAKTHRQTKCPGCGLWIVWVPKKKRAAA